MSSGSFHVGECLGWPVRVFKDDNSGRIGRPRARVLGRQLILPLVGARVCREVDLFGGACGVERRVKNGNEGGSWVGATYRAACVLHRRLFCALYLARCGAHLASCLPPCLYENGIISIPVRRFRVRFVLGLLGRNARYELDRPADLYNRRGVAILIRDRGVLRLL